MLAKTAALAFLLAIPQLAFGQQQGSAQVLAALQQLGKSPQYAAAVKGITGNQVLATKVTNSPVVQAAFKDPTGVSYVLGTFGSPIYKEVLGNAQTSAKLAQSPALTIILAAPESEAPLRLGQLFTSAQLPVTGNAAVDLNTLEATLAQAVGAALVPTPAPAPGPSGGRKATPTAVSGK